MDNKKIRFLKSITASAIITIIFIATITIAADLIPSLKDWLKNVFTHHWVGKSILSLLIFFVFYFVFYFSPSTGRQQVPPLISADAAINPGGPSKSEPTTEKLNKSLYYLFWVSIFSSLAIMIFFVWEAFLK